MLSVIIILRGETGEICQFLVKISKFCFMHEKLPHTLMKMSEKFYAHTATQTAVLAAIFKCLRCASWHLNGRDSHEQSVLCFFFIIIISYYFFACIVLDY